jgi:hypothetical protein
MIDSPFEIYFLEISSAYRTLSSPVRPDSPVGCVATDIREMIESYLSDAQTFRENGDRINEYASLSYAHGWMDAGMCLGYLIGDSALLVLSESTDIPSDQSERLEEKTRRYARMLSDALDSVQPAPEFGSPYYQAATIIIDIANGALKKAMLTINSPDSFSRTLGILSYGYGWLDCGLRAGLFTIIKNPDLFTTETSKKF